MENKFKNSIVLLCMLFVLTSCESEVERKQRESRLEQQRIELKFKEKRAAEELSVRLEQERFEREKLKEIARIQRETEIENERREKAIYDRYINNSLTTGSTPYSYCFGSNKSCTSYGCSEIKIKTPYNSDVLVIIKKNKKVFRHVYIGASSQFSIELPNGTYQAFFYYGKGWNPEKIMKETDCGTLKGGFVTNEIFSKDDFQTLKDQILVYELILQENGNLETEPSNPDEAF
ncbi:hypothetical protein MWU76_15245 [Gelidibacter sp. F2691]|nr:hypothetical protein [Gelidibacter sp. F2691]